MMDGINKLGMKKKMQALFCKHIDRRLLRKYFIY